MFGFGGFREKPTPPFDIYRQYAYDFEHYVTLNNDIEAFVQQVNATRLQGNWDNPEGGLDALMQTLLCTDVIGWRPGTSHVIVFITDAVLHVAGEGVLGGAWQPYEHTCQLVETGGKWVYNSLYHDYPSIAGMFYIFKTKFLIYIQYCTVYRYIDTPGQSGELKSEYEKTRNFFQDLNPISK
jgi:hypothetical protein